MQPDFFIYFENNELILYKTHTLNANAGRIYNLATKINYSQMKKISIIAGISVLIFTGISVLTANETSSNSEYEINRTKLVQQTPKGMVFVEGGTFNMGSTEGDPDEKPIHKVTLSSYYMDTYEVTSADFAAFLNENGNKKEGDVLWLDIEDEDSPIQFVNGEFVAKVGYEKHPILEISWYAANSYAKWMGKRLPTEAEWEYAARGGKASKNLVYAGSNNIAEVAWYDENSDSDTREVGLKKPNELGIYDMTGNVWEWCSDWYDEMYYKTAPELNPKGPETGKYRVLRGGAWVSIAKECRVQARDFGYRHDAFYLNGFRCVQDAK
ncbi:MAG TPA: sulfatase [Bacteroidales bacterium]|nr:sulfatase [Bacteroidales bacterium]